MTEEREVRELHPFKTINRGEDTVVGDDEKVIFADFSPRVIPAEVANEEIDEIISPKGSSAPAPVDSKIPESTPPTEPSSSTTPAQEPAGSEDLKNPKSETQSPDSSTDQKNGQSEPPA